jgi:hypothetical protein
MKSWVDTLLVHDNVWLVLTFHGVDGIGWEAKPHQELKEFFTYIKENEENIWVATFGDATKYMRERMSGSTKVNKSGDEITIDLTHTLDPEVYNVALTLKTYIDPSWTKVKVTQGNESRHIDPLKDAEGSYVLYDALPNSNVVLASEL